MVNIEYNYVHDYGAGITNDFGGIKTGVKGVNCDAVPEAEMEAACFSYIRVYNNLVRDGWPYLCCANFLYSDVSSSGNLFQNNILHGSGSVALVHHCGLDNESRNNIVHREAQPDNHQVWSMECSLTKLNNYHIIRTPCTQSGVCVRRTRASTSPS